MSDSPVNSKPEPGASWIMHQRRRWCDWCVDVVAAAGEVSTRWLFSIKPKEIFFIISCFHTAVSTGGQTTIWWSILVSYDGMFGWVNITEKDLNDNFRNVVDLT